MEKAAKNIPFLERKGIVAEESGLGEERHRPRSEEVGNRAQVIRLRTRENCTEIVEIVSSFKRSLLPPCQITG
jgi:hypothetical protein